MAGKGFLCEIGLQYLTSLRKNWSLLTFASVAVYSDLVKINGKDVLGQGGALFIKRFRPNLAFGFGPVLSNSCPAARGRPIMSISV